MGVCGVDEGFGVDGAAGCVNFVRVGGVWGVVVGNFLSGGVGFEGQVVGVVV